MPDEILYFDSPVQLEIRDIEKREIGGVVVPYGEQIQIKGRPESFAQGALADVNPNQVKLLRDHDPKRPVGRMIALEERADGAYGVYRVSKTREGDDALELASDGVLSFSPGFYAGTQNRAGVHTRIRALPETSLVTFSAYSGSKVLSVREKEGAMPPETDVIEPVVETPVPEIDLGPIETRMEKMEEGFTKLQTLISAPVSKAGGHSITPLRWFQAQVQANFNRNDELLTRLNEDWDKLQTRMVSGEVPLPEAFQTRALADITGTFPGATPIVDASGLVVEQYIASQLVNVLDIRRPLFRSFGPFPMPRSGYAQIPVVTQHTQVAERPTQKSEPVSRKLIVQKKSFEEKWFSGAVDVALELIRTAELPVLEMVWDDMLGQYAIETELDAIAKFNALGAVTGFTYTGAALPTASYGAFALQVATQALVVRINSGAPATKLAVTSAQWPVLVAMVDANDRRQFSTVGQTNADASAALNAESFTLPGGIDVFVAPGLNQAALYNRSSIRVADRGPERVEALNVLDMGQDIGVLGSTMYVPRIPAGVVSFGVAPV